MKRVFLLSVMTFVVTLVYALPSGEKVGKERALIFITGDNVPAEVRVTVDLFKESESPTSLFFYF